jgi:two-component system, chemotaxis family, protein-glutamate methylesterase/glutaminase
MNPPAPIRVLVVEDSSTVRKVVTDALNSDREITVVGTAANGRLGLEELLKVEPDLVTLDIEMPEMDGLTMLSELRKTHPRLPVIMVSTLTGRGASATLDALSRGASDYVTKPSSATNTSATSAIEHFRRELIPRVKALCPRRSAPVAPPRPARSLAVAPAPGRAPIPAGTGPIRVAPSAPSNGATLRPSRPGRFDLLAIGCSTGGPNALEIVLSGLPADFPVPVMVTQHMPPIFTKMLADRLDQKCAIHVVEAEAGMELMPGTVYVAPGDYHLVVKRSTTGFALDTNQGPPENSCRPAVDVMFRSIAEAYGSKAFAVVMTGMGYDGRVGAERIASAGGEIIVQDQETSVVWGMPGAVADAGLATEILPLSQIAAAIDRRFGRRPMPISAPIKPNSTPTSIGATPRPTTPRPLSSRPAPITSPRLVPARTAPAAHARPDAHPTVPRNQPTRTTPARPIVPPRASDGSHASSQGATR